MADDNNVIQFPRRPKKPQPPTQGREAQSPGESLGEGDPEAVARGVVDRLLAEGNTPGEILELVWSMAPGLPPGLNRPQPQLLRRRRAPATYRVRLDLDGAKPPVWRRLELASDLTLDRVHEVVQLAMGWTDSHLHQFTMGPDSKDYRMESFVTDYDLSEGEGDGGIPESEVRLDQVLGKVGHRLFYEYDFGDGWDHTLKLEAIGEYDVSAPPARCLTGRRACPPEDIGGIYTFNEVARFLSKPGSGSLDRDLREVLNWLPPGYDPTEFDLAATNDALAAAVRR